MNLEFNMAVHILSCLAKHPEDKFSSSELAAKICVNPAQLRRVLSKLNEHHYIESFNGKYGGYTANAGTIDVSLADLYLLFMEGRSTRRLFTGSTDNPCDISRSIKDVMVDYQRKEQEVIAAHYRSITVRDVLNDIVQEDYHEV
ncbi:redox-sensitive transcriptional regulator HypR [Macrococcus equipercicus]|uniref:Rrf2 family transcriptional regulator n=1 Tax=Macrococcus equipercicus TaxID=69967 RepID=A0A9Q9BWB2_9STAP|nr:redox-sensitive transcriptional regulator HypR [Macrococcus equipercicus]UTH14213.1 Rrf2 family transcriptional regulator [Macrococcus equipercicus]